MRRPLLCLIGTAAARSLYEDPLAKPYFDVDFNGRPISSHQADALRREGTGQRVRDVQRGHRPVEVTPDDTEMVRWKMMNDGQKRYLCAVPIVPPLKAGEDENDERAGKTDSDKLRIAQTEREEAERATERGLKLLKGLEGTCLYFMAGFWTYKFCYDGGITQFHALPPTPGRPLYPPTEDPNVLTFELGKKRRTPSLSDKRDPAYDSRGPFGTPGTEDSKSLVVEYEGGTYCPLIGAQRKTEVQFQCSPSTNERLGFVKEVSTCQYLIVVQTPRLCSDLAFKAEDPEPVHMIRCRPISDEPERPALDDASAAVASGLPAAQPPSSHDDPGAAADANDHAEKVQQQDQEKDPQSSRPTSGLELERLFDVIEEETARLLELRDAAAEERRDVDRRTRAAEVIVNDLAHQIDAGTLMIDGKLVRKDESKQYDFELHDDDGNVLGQAIMDVVDGDIVVELIDFDPIPRSEWQVVEPVQDPPPPPPPKEEKKEKQQLAGGEKSSSTKAAVRAKILKPIALKDAQNQHGQQQMAFAKAQARKKQRDQLPKQLRDTLRQFHHEEL